MANDEVILKGKGKTSHPRDSNRTTAALDLRVTNALLYQLS